MTTIRYADEAKPPATAAASGIDRDRDTTSIYHSRSFNRSVTTLSDDGIVNIRRLRQPSFDLRSRRSFSRSKDDDVEDDDPGLRRQSDYKEKQTFSGRYLLWLSYQSVGVIYGDVGTSPLYVYSSVFSSEPSRENLIGVLSLVIYALTIMVTLKYILIVLFCDNDGEGGSFSTYSLLCRYLNITNRDPREATMVQMRRYMSGELPESGRGFRRRLEKSKFARRLLQVIGILAVTAVISDGVLTPAQSVLGAVQGLEVVQPNISKSVVIGVTDAILFLLFLIQPLGISSLTVFFSPIVIIWLSFNASSGIYNLVKYDAGVFKAFDPGEAFTFLIRNGHDGWKMLGGVLLSFTGVEALFADLGAFSRGAIQLSWLSFVYPCLLLTYIGQAAYIADHPAAYDNPVFNSVPPGMLYPTLVFAMLAAIVASQAIITATFQLISQVMKLSYFPQIKVIHTSKTFHGQLFVPLANWLLMIGTILVASIFNNTTSLGNAYGVCVMLVTFFDTTMVSLAATFVWKFNPWFVAFPWLFFACYDWAYLSSALEKVPQGAWFTLSLAAILASIFLIWRNGKEQQWAVEAEDRFPTSHFVVPAAGAAPGEGKMQLADRYHGTPISKIRGLGIYFDKAGETTPIVFSQFVIKLTAVPEVMVFFHLRPLERPSVLPEERFSVSRLAIPDCYRVVVRYGYNDSVLTDDLAAIIYQQVRLFIETSPPKVASAEWHKTSDQHKPAAGAPPLSDDEKEAAATALAKSPSPVGSPIAKTTSHRPADAPDDDGLRPSMEHNLSPSSTHGDDDLSAVGKDLARLDEAYAHKVLYIVGKEQMKIKTGTRWPRKVLLWAFLWMRENTRGKIADLRLPGADLVEVGFLKEI